MTPCTAAPSPRDPNEDDAPPPPTTVHLNRARNGDRESQEWIVKRFTPFFLAFATKHVSVSTSDRVDIEDVVADTWLIVLRRLPTVEERDGRRTPTFVTFAKRVLRHTLNDTTRRRGRHEFSSDSSDVGDTVIITPGLTRGILGDLVRREAGGEVMARIEALSSDHRDLLLRSVVDNEKLVDIAADLGEKPDTVRHRCRRLLQRLGDGLGELADELD